MTAVARHPDLLTRPQAAAFLGVSVSALAHGFGPAPLPSYRRPVYYSKAQCEQWLAEERERAWASTSGVTTTRTSGSAASTPGGAASKSEGTKSASRRAQQIAERLRSKSAESAPSSKPRHLVAVPEDA